MIFHISCVIVLKIEKSIQGVLNGSYCDRVVGLFAGMRHVGCIRNAGVRLVRFFCREKRHRERSGIWNADAGYRLYGFIEKRDRDVRESSDRQESSCIPCKHNLSETGAPVHTRDLSGISGAEELSIYNIAVNRLND